MHLFVCEKLFSKILKSSLAFALKSHFFGIALNVFWKRAIHIYVLLPPTSVIHGIASIIHVVRNMSNLGARLVLVAMDTVRHHHQRIFKLIPRQHLHHCCDASVSMTKIKSLSLKRSTE